MKVARIQREINHVVEMPDARSALLVRVILQNDGRLSKKRERHFADLTDEQVERVEEAVHEAQGVG